MSRWSPFGRYESAQKKPPPERGIRIKKVGATWWGQRWIEALQDVLRGDSARLARGRTYARAGRTHDLVVQGGKVTAKVTGSRPRPYDITIQLPQLGATAWRKAIAAMAAKAQFSAELLAGQMPRAIDEAFAEAGVSLFPKERGDLSTTCSCPDWGDPCKHVAATHYVLGEALDRDPFLLFELRGRTRDQVLDALRAARGSTGDGKERKRRKASARSADARLEIPTVNLGELTTDDYDRPRAPLPRLRLCFDEPLTHGAILRQLGAPAAWEGEESPEEVLAPTVRAAAEAAREMAMAELDEGGEA
jgi:uncharacterized Zn finger protein